MKFVLAGYGSRGDVEPCVAVGRELLRRGHEVRMAVPPDLVCFAESAGLAAVAYGLDTRPWLDVHRDFWSRFFRSFWKIQELIGLWREVWDPVAECWAKISATLTSLADGADLLFTGVSFEEAAANVAEYYDIPLATLHYFPARANGQLLPFLPAPGGPLRHESVRVGELAHGQKDGRRAASGTWSAEGNRPLAAAGHRTRIVGNPGLRRGLLSRAGSRMVEMGWPTALCWCADDGIGDGCR